MMRLLAGPVVCAALALTGCGGSAGGSADESPEPAASSSSTAPERPQVGDCHRLSARELLGSADTKPAVECQDEHTTETAYVGTFKAAVLSDPQTLTGDKANRRAAQTCRKEAASYLGTDRGRQLLTRVEVLWFVPTPEQVDAGADWLRCDVVVLERDDRLMPLPRSMKGALRQERGFDRYGLCGTARPGTKDFRRVVCGEEHSWRAISTIGIDGGKRYPGAGAVRAQGEEECQGQARAAQDDALQYDYGWEWPTKAQWEAGQRHGYCWAPA
jgi:hypothetical protein